SARRRPLSSRHVRRNCMRRLVPLLLAVPLVLVGCAKKTEQQNASNKPTFKVGLVFDIGGRGDKSFNDAAYAGLDSAKKSLGIDFEVNEPNEGGDRESALRQFAA